MDFKKLGLFAAGTLFGTAGIKILTSKDAARFTRKLPPPRCGPKSA